MKTLFKIMALFMLLFHFSACSKEDEMPIIPELEVNYANIDGIWMLTEWNGQSISEDIYCYIEFNRKEHTFRMFQKFDSMYTRLITGKFSLEKDDEWGNVICGTYDYGMGEWNNSYIITNLLESGSMIWTVKGDESDVTKYERCDKIPENVLAETVTIE